MSPYWRMFRENNCNYMYNRTTSWVDNWPHRQGGCFVCGKLLPERLHGFVLRKCCSRCRIPSLTPLSGAACDRIQLGVALWATSVSLFRVEPWVGLSTPWLHPAYWVHPECTLHTEYTLSAPCTLSTPWVASQTARWPGIPKERVRFLLAVASLVICGLHLHRASEAHGVLPCEGWGLTASQLDPPSLTTLSVAGCGRLQLGAAYSTTSVALLQVVDNWPHNSGSRFYSGNSFW